jgi:hypothetical protein
VFAKSSSLAKIGVVVRVLANGHGLGSSDGPLHTLHAPRLPHFNTCQSSHHFAVAI